MKKLAILASLFMVMTSFVYSEPANARCGQQAIRFDGNQRAGDDEFFWLNNADYQRAGGKKGKFEGVPGFECDDEGCTNLSLIEMPAGHCFNGNCNTSEAVYRCSIGGNDKWVNIGTIRDCTEAELVNKRTLSERGMTDTTVLIANTNTANTTKYAWVGINNGYICRIKSGSQITPSVKCTHGGKQYNPGETVNCYESQAAFNATGATKATKKCLNTGQWSSCNHICPTNKPVFSGGKCIARSNNTVVKPPVQEVPEVESKCNCDERQLAKLAAIEVKYEFI